MARKELSLRDIKGIIKDYERTEDEREAREMKGDIAHELSDLHANIDLEKHEGRDGSPLMKQMQKKYDAIVAMADRAFGRGWLQRMGRGYESQIRSARSLTASDRSALIRLASTMVVGSPERKAILAGLSKQAKVEEVVISQNAGGGIETWLEIDHVKGETTVNEGGFKETFPGIPSKAEIKRWQRQGFTD